MAIKRGGRTFERVPPWAESGVGLRVLDENGKLIRVIGERKQRVPRRRKSTSRRKR